MTQHDQHAAMDDAAAWAERHCRPRILGTWQQGASARRAGQPAEACPYTGKGPTAIRERSAWRNGWRWAGQRMQQETLQQAAEEAPMPPLRLLPVRECLLCARAFTTDTHFAACPPCRAFPPPLL